MKRSELTVTMRMSDFDELLVYKEKYINLRKELNSTLTNRDGKYYDFDVTKALNIVRKTSNLPNDANINNLL